MEAAQHRTQQLLRRRDAPDAGGGLSSGEAEKSKNPSFFVQQFEAWLDEDHARREVELELKTNINAISSPYSFRRLQGLKGTLALLSWLPPNGLSLPHDKSTPPLSLISTVLHHTFPREDLATTTGGPLTKVSLVEKELAIRIVHGLCILSVAQRRIASETKFLRIVTDEVASYYRCLASSGGNAPHHPDTPLVLLGEMIDAAEACCHASPVGLYCFMDLDGVNIFFDVVQCATAAQDLRNRIAEFFCVMLTETTSAVLWPTERRVAEKFASVVRGRLAEVSSPHEDVSKLVESLGNLTSVRGRMLRTLVQRSEASAILQKEVRAREKRYAEFLVAVTKK